MTIYEFNINIVISGWNCILYNLELHELSFYLQAFCKFFQKGLQLDEWISTVGHSDSTGGVESIMAWPMNGDMGISLWRQRMRHEPFLELKGTNTHPSGHMGKKFAN